jgi:hypothetical protein
MVIIKEYAGKEYMTMCPKTSSKTAYLSYEIMAKD